MGYPSSSRVSLVSDDLGVLIGLESVEARLLVYKKNKAVYEEDIKVLKYEIHLREVAITELRRTLELAQKQKDKIKLTVEKFENSSKNLSKLIDYLEEFTSEPIVIKPVVENSEAKASEAKPKAVRKNNGAPIIKDWVSDNEEDDVPQAKIEKKTFKPSFAKIEFVKPKQQEKTARKTVNHVEQNRQNIHTPRGNQRNWNNMMSQRLGSNFEMFNKACYVCGSFDHLQVDCKKVNQKQFQNTKPIWNNAKRVNHQNFAKKTHPCPKKNIVPRAVLMKSGQISLNTVRQVNTDHPKITVNSARLMTNLSKSAHSTVKWPIHNNTAFKNYNFNQRVNTVKDKKFNTARPKAVVNAVKRNNVNAVMASIQVSDDMGPQKKLIFLSNYEEIDGGYVAFGGNPKGGKITCKDDYSRFSWVFFLATKDETSGILKSFITRVENLIDQRVKVIRCGNETEFKNKEMNKFCERKGIKREFSIARTPQQNGVAERKNRTLIEAARIMLANFKLPTTFWAKVVNSVCYVQNRVLVTKPHNKIPYELFLGRKPALGFMKPFRCLVTILNTIDHLDKFNGKADEGFFVGSKSSQDDGSKPLSDDKKKVDEDPRKDSESIDQEKDDNVNSTNNVNAASTNKVNVVEADMNNLDTTIQVSPIPTTRVHKDHPVEQIIGDLNLAPQTRRMTKNLEEHGLFSSVQQRTNHKDFQNCLFACFLSQEEPKKVIHALKDPSWIEAMQEELLQFKLQEVWTLVELPNGKRAIVFAPFARIEAIRIFLAYASFKDFVVYQMEVKTAFLYGKIEEEVHVCQPSGFEDPNFPDRVYKVEKALYGLYQVPKACQDKYVTEILKKFGFTDVKIASTPMESQKILLKDEDGEEVDVYLYRSMIGSLMYLTSSRPDIMFVVCACARYQVNPKVSHLHVVKRIFRDTASDHTIRTYFEEVGFLPEVEFEV
ncbi:retrovirus-related pol polyprotein from transposon TNT 1-94 [Tanacetum coccineum]